MPRYNQIIDDYAHLGHFAGSGEKPVVDTEDKRHSLIEALNARKTECQLRFRIMMGILTIAVAVLLYLSISQPKGIETFKNLASTLGGGSIVAIVTYIASIRDELTKIKQTLIIAGAMDDTALNSMLLALSTK